jgi:hypothetical protein
MEECQVHASTMMDSTKKPFESTASATADLDKRGKTFRRNIRLLKIKISKYYTLPVIF